MSYFIKILLIPLFWRWLDILISASRASARHVSLRFSKGFYRYGLLTGIVRLSSTGIIITATLLAHGVHYTELRDGYGVQVQYEDDSPLDFADVQIFRPGESEFEFQQGLTDENGIFMFKPDTNGLWTIRVSDGLGHGKVIHLKVTEGDPTSLTPANRPLLYKIISGIGYILFGFSTWYFIAIRRKGSDAHS